MPPSIHSVWNRVYADFLMPSRLGAYRDLLVRMLEAGYTIESIEAFAARSRADAPDDGRRVVLRHDIDTDPITARAMWEIEQEVGAHGSYFFRLSTLDLPLMHDIAASGSDASYHYEELATVAKRRRLRTAAEAARHVPEAQDEFRRNITDLRAATGLPMRVVASHGDFINRRLGVPNWVILDDPAFRAAAGIDLETYDEAAMRPVTSRYNDTLHPRYWMPDDPVQGIAARSPVIYLLVHPRHWRTAPLVNLRDDIGRVTQAIRHVAPTRTHAMEQKP